MIVIVALFALYLLERNAMRRAVEQQAVVLAEVVARHATVVQSVYTKQIVEKLSKDGFGAHANWAHHRGFVPMPAVFLKLVGHATSQSYVDLFSYRQISKWHLGPSQGLRDDFEHWAWMHLEAQDQANPSGPIAWQPAWRVERQDNGRVLRFMVADPASSSACVECHNHLESRPQTVEWRMANGTPLGKQWRLHQLIGAISVTIPLEQIEMGVFAQNRPTIIWVSTILIASLIVIVGGLILNVRAISDPSSLPSSATHDSTTGLLNRAGLQSELDHLFRSAHARSQNHAFCCLTVHGLDTIRERGNASVIKTAMHQLAQCIRDRVRREDIVARVRDNGFVVLARSCDLAQAKEIAAQLEYAILHCKISTLGISPALWGTTAVTLLNAASGTVSSALDMMALACEQFDKSRIASTKPPPPHSDTDR